MTDKTRSFHLGDILSISHGRLLSPRLIEGVYDILNFMTGDDLFTHQLPRAGDECKPHLLEQLPFLHGVKLPEVITPENHRDVLADLVVIHGAYHEVRPVPGGAHLVIDPIKEAAAMVGEDKIIPVVLPDRAPGAPNGRRESE